MPRSAYALLLFLAALFLAPAAANATQVSVAIAIYGDDIHNDPGVFSHVTISGDPGEANNLTIAPAGMDITVSDPGVTLTAGGDYCKAVDAHTVTCHAAPLEKVTVGLGDGDDTATILPTPPTLGATDPTTVVDGGAGNDTISGALETTGGEGNDTLTGSDRFNTLNGGAGDDKLVGLGADDRFTGGPGDDAIDGGDGTDTVSYEERSEPVAVDLSAGTGGAPGEHDTITGVEDLIGGTAADTLTGDDGPNNIDETGRTSAGDRIDGRGGDDTLWGTAGADDLTGGAGNDTVLHAKPGDSVSCGDGVDHVVSPAATALLPLDCELALRGTIGAGVQRSAGHAPRLLVRQDDDDNVRCDLRATLRENGGHQRLLATATIVKGKPGKDSRVTFKQTTLGKRALKRAGVKTRVELSSRAGCGRRSAVALRWVAQL